MEDHSPAALKRARKLRKEMTLPEALLWRLLKGKPMGVKFRKQHPIGEFVVDFYCAEKRLGIEIDGIAHDKMQRLIAIRPLPPTFKVEIEFYDAGEKGPKPDGKKYTITINEPRQLNSADLDK